MPPEFVALLQTNVNSISEIGMIEGEWAAKMI